MNCAIQIIDENKNYKLEELVAFFKSSSALANSFSPVVAVFGTQSSGKSTLLNYLFDTKFDVMSGQKRAQTTHGIWLAVEPKAHTIILDVEGSDGIERGEDKDFERKAALFSLSIADVLIINVWENSIGLYNASNINLLKTVLDVYFEIYSSLSASKTTILFVVRDYVGVTPEEGLETVIKEELNKIWSSIEKPVSLEKSRFEELFSLKFAFLPHKIFKTEEFLLAIDCLREKFFGQNDQDRIFDSFSSKRILLEDFPIYSSSIWNIVETSKSLDLPTQQELLAQHRCEETISEIYSNLTTNFVELNELIEKNELEFMVKQLKVAVVSASEQYFDKLHRYPKNIVQHKNEILIRRIKDLIEPLFNNYCLKIEKQALNIFELQLQTERNQISEAGLKNSVQRALTFFRSSIQASGLNYEDRLISFESELNQIAQSKILDFLTSNSRKVLKNIKISTRSIFSDSFGMFSDNQNFWLTIESRFMTEIAEALNQFDQISESFLGTETFIKSKKELENELESIYLESLCGESNKSTLILRVNKVIDKSFRFDSSGRPRHWENLSMIDDAFDKAIEKTELFIETISIYKPSEEFISAFPDFDKEIVLLTENVKKDTKELMKREAESMFLEAKRSLVSGSNSIPAWVIILLIILGWNEFVAIISSPIYLFLTLVLISAFFIVHHLHLAGPLMTMISIVSRFLISPINQNSFSDNKAKSE